MKLQSSYAINTVFGGEFKVPPTHDDFAYLRECIESINFYAKANFAKSLSGDVFYIMIY